MQEQLFNGFRKTTDGTLAMYIDGEWTQASDGGTRPVINPANGETIAYVAEGTLTDVNRAVAAARRAFDEDGWADATALERSQLLLKLADKIEEHASELAELETLNNGK